MDGQRGWVIGRVDVGQIGWVAEIQHFQKAANKGHKGCRIDRKYRFSRTCKLPVGFFKVLLKWCMRVAAMKVSFGSNLFPKPPFFWEGRRPKKNLSLKLKFHPICLHRLPPKRKRKSSIYQPGFFLQDIAPRISHLFLIGHPEEPTSMYLTPSRFFDGDIRKHTTIMGSRKSLAMVHVGDFLPSKFPPILRLQATGHDVFSFQGSNSIQPPHPKKVLPSTHTKKAPVCCMTVAWQKKNAGSFFECAFFQDTLTTKKNYTGSV